MRLMDDRRCETVRCAGSFPGRVRLVSPFRSSCTSPLRFLHHHPSRRKKVFSPARQRATLAPPRCCRSPVDHCRSNVATLPASERITNATAVSDFLESFLKVSSSHCSASPATACFVDCGSHAALLVNVLGSRSRWHRVPRCVRWLLPPPEICGPPEDRKTSFAREPNRRFLNAPGLIDLSNPA